MKNKKVENHCFKVELLKMTNLMKFNTEIRGSSVLYDAF